MAALTDPVKEFIVQALACYDSPSRVAKAVKEEFGIDITRMQASSYNFGTATCRGLSKKLQVLFESTRSAFKENVGAVPAAHQAYRLRVLQRSLELAEQQGNTSMVSQLLEQAAKEVGGAFTNRRELTGAGGGPIESKTQVVDQKAVSAAVDELRGEY